MFCIIALLTWKMLEWTQDFE